MLDQFMLGAIVTCCGIIGLFFLRFWKKSRDRLFICFALAFWLLGLNWFLLAVRQDSETHSELSLLRLAAFGVILLGIWRKNRARPAAQGSLIRRLERVAS